MDEVFSTESWNGLQQSLKPWPRRASFSTIVLLLLSIAGVSLGTQVTGCCGQTFPAAEFQVTQIERSLAFYHDVIGLEYPPDWNGRVNPPSSANRALTGVADGALRVASLSVPGATWHLQLVDITGIERRALRPRRQDAGSTGLIFYVRDFDASLYALQKFNAQIASLTGQPVSKVFDPTRGYQRSILAKDPDGFYVELREIDPVPAGAPLGNVVDARMTITIRDTEPTARYWRDVLDFDVLQGVPNTKIRKSIATLRTSGMFGHPNVLFEFLEFENVNRQAQPPRYQDPGSGAFVLRLRSPADTGPRGHLLMDVIQRAKASGFAHVLTTRGKALDQGRRFAVFTQDANGFIMEFTEAVDPPASEGVAKGCK